MSQRASPAMPKSDLTIAAMSSAFGCAVSCLVMSRPKSDSLAARVTMIPVAVEIKSAGTCVTMPSPTVSKREALERDVDRSM